jgi:acetylornithine deacetylase/succinyl-diaminopimelate desuccinylase-like protein
MRAQAQTPRGGEAAFRELYKELIEINTTLSVPGHARLFRDAGDALAVARRRPTYGLSGLFHDKEGSRAHGLNERIRVKSLMDGREFLYEIVKIYANQND